VRIQEIRTKAVRSSLPTYLLLGAGGAQAMKYQIRFGLPLLFGTLLIAVAGLGVLIWQGYGVGWTGFGQYTGPVVDKSQTFMRAKTLWDWFQSPFWASRS
jgi:hypothetical protein